MAQPVWVLSVDLQTKTATFQSGMADAAKSAKGAFKDIQTGAGEMGRETGTSMTEARHGVMLLGEEFGVHLPRALTSFIASIGPVGAAMEAAFPFLAIIVGATLLLQHLSKVREEGENIARGQVDFGTAVNNSFNLLEQKLLQAEIHSDELNKNHFAALKKQLELIDLQTLADLSGEFDKLAGKADHTFKELEGHFYTFGIGSDGAKHALLDFKTEYDSLLSKKDTKGAHDLLAGTLASAERVLAFQKQYAANQMDASGKTGRQGDYNKFEEAALELKKAGVGVTRDEVLSQESLVTLLRSQVNAEGEIGKIKKVTKDNARTGTGREETNEAFRRMKAQFDAERTEQEAEDRDREEARNQAITRIQEAEKLKIEATQKGSAERLAAIDAAIKEENNKGLQETSFYRSLLVQRVQTVQEMTQEEARIREEAGKEASKHDEKMGELRLAAEHQHQLLLNSTHHMAADQLVAQEIQEANEEYAVKMEAYNREIQALDKHGKDYANKLRAIQDREAELTQQHENQVTQIKEKAEIARNTRILSAETQFEQALAQGLAGSIMRHQSFAAMMSSIGNQVATAILQNAIMSALMMDFGKEKDAAHAARKAFNWGWEHGGPAAPILAPVLGAAAFASVMAFAEGGIVPGVGRGDIVPAILTPGEHVADKELTEGLRGMVRNGGSGGGHGPIHIHHNPTYHVQTIDGDGIRATLTQHAEEFRQHFQSTLRQMNH